VSARRGLRLLPSSVEVSEGSRTQGLILGLVFAPPAIVPIHMVHLSPAFIKHTESRISQSPLTSPAQPIRHPPPSPLPSHADHRLGRRLYVPAQGRRPRVIRARRDRGAVQCGLGAAPR
jgi:hypothetical protein